MTWHLSALVLVSIATSAISASVAVVAWRRRAAPGATALALLMLAVTVWTFFRALEAAAPDVASKVWWAKMEYVGHNSIGLLWLRFAFRHGAWRCCRSFPPSRWCWRSPMSTTI